jgi:hypothetical protein
MAKIGGEKHLVTEDTPSVIYESCLVNPLDEKITQKIELLRISSTDFLGRALAVHQLQFA